MNKLLLGIDLGTSGVKVGIYTLEGTLVGIGRSSPYTLRAPKPGWAESHPELWWQGIVEAIHASYLDAGVRGDAIGAIGLSVFYPSVVLIDAQGKSLYPALLYCDQRSLPQVRQIESLIPREEYQQRIGNVLVPGTCAVTSLAWLRDEQPDVYETARVLGFGNSYITGRLTGRYFTDPTMASVTGLTDINNPYHWSQDLCQKLSIDHTRLPAIAGSSEVIGEVSTAASVETDLPEGTPVVCGCGDAVASPFGAGALDEGTVVYVAGSTDCVTTPFARPTEDRRWINSAYVRKESWLGIGTMSSTGTAVDWFSRECLHEQGSLAIDRMTDFASSSEPGATGLLFLPYLQGERTPIWDPLARGIFIGISSSTTRKELARAVFEGTALGLRDVMMCLEEIRAHPVTEIRAVGGGTQNALWNQIKADVLQKPLDVLDFQETGSLGAALLAGVGTHMYGSFQEASRVARQMIGIRRIEPNSALRDVYDELFSLYRRLYPQTREILHSLADRTSI
jgi:xylulokinase